MYVQKPTNSEETGNTQWKGCKKNLKKTSKVNLPAKLNRIGKRPKCLNVLEIIKL